MYHFPSAPLILSEEEIKGKDGDLCAAFSIPLVRTFPEMEAHGYVGS